MKDDGIQGNKGKRKSSGFSQWSKKKPKPQECLLFTARFLGGEWEYVLYTIKKTDGENEAGEQCWYWGMFTADGDEWGDLSDLKADLYYMMKLLR